MKGSFRAGWKRSWRCPASDVTRQEPWSASPTGEAAPILDTNVRRVLTRLFVRRRPAGAAKLDRRLWVLAEAVIPPDRVWEFNQGLMDFGATVCTARNPKCSTCPLRSLCAFYQHANDSRGTPA